MNEPHQKQCPIGLDPIKMGRTFSLIETIHEKVETIDKKVDAGFKEQNGRVRALENWRWYLIGIVSSVACVIALVIKLVF